jgi:hypothetical protein
MIWERKSARYSQADRQTAYIRLVGKVLDWIPAEGTIERQH